MSCVLNILLDYLFVACFGWGIAGAASATVLSQALAAVLVGLHLYRQEHPVIRTAPSAGLIVPILQLSITGIVQNGASAISMFFIQGIINTFGVNEISAYTSAYKIESILTIPAVNLGVALSGYIGQNVGAGEYDRTRQGLKDSFKIAAVFTTLAMAILWFASPLLMVLVVGKEMAVIPIGVQYLRIISVTFPLCVSLYLLTNFLRGAGEIAYPLFNTLLELCFRTFSAFVLAHYFGFVGVLLCRPLSFVVSTISLSCRLLSGKWKDKINHSV